MKPCMHDGASTCMSSCQVGDQLRELLLNPDSENNSLFNSDDQSQLIFQIFKCLVAGGAMCQPESKLQRYKDGLGSQTTCMCVIPNLKCW